MLGVIELINLLLVYTNFLFSLILSFANKSLTKLYYQVCEEWKEMKRISAKEGLIAIPYEKNFSIYSRLYQILKLYLFAPSSGLFSCPLAMTDGAAKTLQVRYNYFIFLVLYHFDQIILNSRIYKMEINLVKKLLKD